MQQKASWQACSIPSAQAEHRDPRPCRPLLRVIPLAAVWGSCQGTPPQGSKRCQERKPRGGRTGWYHHACLPSPHAECCPGAGTQPVAVMGAAPSAAEPLPCVASSRTPPCDPGHLLATPSGGDKEGSTGMSLHPLHTWPRRGASSERQEPTSTTVLSPSSRQMESMRLPFPSSSLISFLSILNLINSPAQTICKYLKKKQPEGTNYWTQQEQRGRIVQRPSSRQGSGLNSLPVTAAGHPQLLRPVWLKRGWYRQPQAGSRSLTAGALVPLSTSPGVSFASLWSVSCKLQAASFLQDGMWESAASSVPSALEVRPGAAGKVFPGCAATGWAPSPHFSQLGLQSNFLAGFLLFHITTIMNTPTTRERRFSQKTSNYGHF